MYRKVKISLGGIDTKDIPYMMNSWITYQHCHAKCGAFDNTIEGKISSGKKRSNKRRKIVEGSNKKVRIHKFIIILPKGYETDIGEWRANIIRVDKD